MKKISIAIGLIIVFTGFSLYESSQKGSATVTPVSKNPTANISPSTTTNTPSTPTSTYKDGTYTGQIEDGFYGNVQVQATIAGGKITNVQFLQYPNEQGHTLEISNQSMPVLTQEAIQTQNANVDIVTGATQTSQAFQESLKSALDKAKS